MIRPLVLLSRAALALAAIALGPISTAAGAELRGFDAGSMQAIRAAHAGKPFVLAFWATDCVACRKEMALWKSMAQKHPKLPIVLVATDLPGEEELVQRFLTRYDPGPVERWAYADEFSERVRYAVDRTWRGELPRAYFFDAEHRAEARSGLIDQDWIENWISRQAKPARKP
jgi:thiol-disulfide isomerase/thioredoxin